MTYPYMLESVKVNETDVFIRLRSYCVCSAITQKLLHSFQPSICPGYSFSLLTEASDHLLASFNPVFASDPLDRNEAPILKMFMW